MKVKVKIQSSPRLNVSVCFWLDPEITRNKRLRKASRLMAAQKSSERKHRDATNVASDSKLLVTRSKARTEIQVFKNPTVSERNACKMHQATRLHKKTSKMRLAFNGRAAILSIRLLPAVDLLLQKKGRSAWPHSPPCCPVSRCSCSRGHSECPPTTSAARWLYPARRSG